MFNDVLYNRGITMATPDNAPYKLKQREPENTACWFYRSGYTEKVVNGQIVHKGIPYVRPTTCQ
jgi:hypothetical protein